MPTSDYTVLRNGLLRDDRLSYCARGVLGELLSRPTGWETNADALSERARRHRAGKGEGRRAMRAAFAELEAAGYMLRRRERGSGGKFVTVLEVFDVPQDRGTAYGTSVDGTSVSGTSLRSTDVRSTEEEDDAPSARSAGDARRATTGSSVRASSGSAAASKTNPAPAKTTSNSSPPRLTPRQAAAIRTIETAWPPELAALLPKYRPAALRDALLAALDSRTAAQLAARVARRWHAHGYADALHSADGKGIGSPVGVAVGLVRPSRDCPDPMCEDGVTIDSGAACRACVERRADRGADRRAGGVPAQRATPDATATWWECVDCRDPYKGAPPPDGVCGSCNTAAGQTAAAVAARWQYADACNIPAPSDDEWAAAVQRAAAVAAT